MKNLGQLKVTEEGKKKKNEIEREAQQKCFRISEKLFGEKVNNCIFYI